MEGLTWDLWMSRVSSFILLAKPIRAGLPVEPFGMSCKAWNFKNYLINKSYPYTVTPCYTYLFSWHLLTISPVPSALMKSNHYFWMAVLHEENALGEPLFTHLWGAKAAQLVQSAAVHLLLTFSKQSCLASPSCHKCMYDYLISFILMENIELTYTSLKAWEALVAKCTAHWNSSIHLF